MALKNQLTRPVVYEDVRDILADIVHAIHNGQCDNKWALDLLKRIDNLNINN